VSKGIALSCTYTSSLQQKAKVSVGERIKQLEALVRSLIEQQQTSLPSGGSSADSPANPFQATPDTSPSAGPEGTTPLASADEDTECTTAEHGSIRIQAHGVTYVSSVHWAAVLHSISELKGHYEKEEEVRMIGNGDHVPRCSPGPRLLYEPVYATKADILTSMPTRAAVDRIIARYFIAQGVTPGMQLFLYLGEHAIQAVRIANFCGQSFFTVASSSERYVPVLISKLPP
jgi:hypothetical protein